MAINALRRIVSRLSRFDLFLILCVFASAIKLTYKIETIVDIILSDESYYLYNGVNLIKQGFPVAEWAPFYAIWYWLLSLVEPSKDNVNLYFLNHKLLIALTATMLYVALRSLGCNRLITTITAFIYLISGIPVIWPRPTHFALLLILLFITIQTYLRAEIFFYYVLSLTLLSVSYVRPEYFVSFLVISIAIFILEIRTIFFTSPRGKTSSYRRLLLYTACFIALIALLGMPTSSGNRSWWAFASHFALRWTWQNKTDLDPWVDYQQITASVFGHANTIFAAMWVNPGAFFAYLFENLKGYFENTLSIFDDSLKDNSPSLNDLNPTLNLIVRFGELAIVLLACVQIFRHYRSRIKQDHFRTLIRLLVIVFFVELSVIPASIIIFPRYHYLIIHVVLLYVLLAFMLSKTLKGEAWNLDFKQTVVTGFLLLLLTPTLAQGWCLANICLFQRQQFPARPNLETIYLLRSLKIKQPVNVLAFDIEYRTFLGDRYHRIDPASKTSGFSSFMRQNEIEMVIVSAELKQDVRLMADQEWNAFLRDYASLDYQRLEVPHTERSLLVRRKLLSSHSLPQATIQSPDPTLTSKTSKVLR
ncbi:hypothetical protein [Stenomitos frigidus]|uniref:Glycosyltransferase RgtA/B/C/D-like domain-containing protein n=1 Tax=Stenomitos frigidus ULC18 TaxID=2107698 RepID=A0A2T1EA16_9CYAN|nr:hypothetical protein [Stenomitos frigidus]PSB29570.1 hypothetical protein C7B82_11160 [Stenomitos frigidus ULC18]